MNKKEKKRDVATFANMLKELMQTQEGDLLQTLDRDLQHFLYGRIALLVKHNDGQPIGSIADISAVVGAGLADITKEFVRGRNVEPDKLKELFDNAQANLTHGFQARRPAVNIQAEQPAEESKEPVA
jgi:hypothetical protein